MLPAVAQYREVGVLLWRGFTLDRVMAQCFGNHEDSGKGRQMPVVCHLASLSVSCDSFAYRGRQEVENRKKIDNPITCFRLFMESRGWWNETEEKELKSRLKQDVLAAFKRAETLKKPGLTELFSDVYAEEPGNIREQREELA
ncbi:hypothetical protein EDB19DRAFT_1774605 [Suillus lakei]|nr:hypothetical protein EDB19DRAFT_1774605 [Suillus lakei]